MTATQNSGDEETPAKHFSSCGPDCKHVVLCRACVDCHWLCETHQDNPAGTFSWREEGEVAPSASSQRTSACTQVIASSGTDLKG